MYALRAFRNAGKSVELVELASAKVSTPTPSTFSETMEQRVRWMNKTGNVGDNLNTFLGLWAVGLHLLFFLLLLLTWFGEVWWFTVLLLIIKTILDGSLIRMETTTFSKETIIGVLLFELFYPVYLVALLGSAMFHQPEWKGR
jgi:hypothetical protein